MFPANKIQDYDSKEKRGNEKKGMNIVKKKMKRVRDSDTKIKKMKGC